MTRIISGLGRSRIKIVMEGVKTNTTVFHQRSNLSQRYALLNKENESTQHLLKLLKPIKLNQKHGI